METNISTGVEFIQVDAVVRRACRKETCKEFQSVDCLKHGTTEDLGTIAYWHKNPVRRALFAARQRLKRLV